MWLGDCQPRQLLQPADWSSPGRWWKNAAMATEPQQARWPAHLRAGALRVVRWSARYEETVTFYRDTIAGARPVAQIDYWQANGGVTYQDPDGREVVFASWTYIPPGP